MIPGKAVPKMAFIGARTIIPFKDIISVDCDYDEGDETEEQAAKIDDGQPINITISNRRDDICLAGEYADRFLAEYKEYLNFMSTPLIVPKDGVELR